MFIINPAPSAECEFDTVIIVLSIVEVYLQTIFLNVNTKELLRDYHVQIITSSLFKTRYTTVELSPLCMWLSINIDCLYQKYFLTYVKLCLKELPNSYYRFQISG